MFGSSYKIARVWGIPIRIHISLIFLLVVLAITSGFSGGLAAIAELLALELGVFASIALHELGHSFVALRKGCRVREITLMFIGGAAQMEEIPRRPWDEFLMAVAGPAVSVLLGVACLFGGGYLPLLKEEWPVLRHVHLVDNLVQVVGVINLWLAMFNLLPAFPMDGGRVLRAALTTRLGRIHATLIASRLGKVTAVIFGIYGFFPPRSWILVAIAFFLYSAADREYRMVAIQEAMRRQGLDVWPPSTGSSDEAGDDEVVVSPSPYSREPESRAPVRPIRRNPFRDLFGR
jgi:Zn-dependent protease